MVTSSKLPLLGEGKMSNFILKRLLQKHRHSQFSFILKIYFIPVKQLRINSNLSPRCNDCEELELTVIWFCNISPTLNIVYRWQKQYYPKTCVQEASAQENTCWCNIVRVCVCVIFFLVIHLCVYTSPFLYDMNVIKWEKNFSLLKRKVLLPNSMWNDFTYHYKRWHIWKIVWVLWNYAKKSQN